MIVMETVPISEKKVYLPALQKYPLSYNETLTVNHFYFSIKSGPLKISFQQIFCQQSLSYYI